MGTSTGHPEIAEEASRSSTLLPKFVSSHEVHFVLLVERIQASQHRKAVRWRSRLMVLGNSINMVRS